MISIKLPGVRMMTDIIIMVQKIGLWLDSLSSGRHKWTKRQTFFNEVRIDRQFTVKRKFLCSQDEEALPPQICYFDWYQLCIDVHSMKRIQFWCVTQITKLIFKG